MYITGGSDSLINIHTFRILAIHTCVYSPSIKVDARHIGHAVVSNEHVSLHAQLQDSWGTDRANSTGQERLTTGHFEGTRDIDKLWGRGGEGGNVRGM